MKCLFLFLTFCTLNGYAQSGDELIKKPILQFFEGMRKGDSALIQETLAPDAILQSVAVTKEGAVTVRHEDFKKFVTAVTKPHEGVYDERIKFDTIRADDNLAVVWTPYQFYISDKFSHCGVNSFQLVRINNQWKIQYIIDTRRRDNCQ